MNHLLVMPLFLKAPGVLKLDSNWVVQKTASAVIKKFPKTASTQIDFQNALGFPIFHRFHHKMYSGFHKPVKLGTRGFPKPFNNCTCGFR